MAMSFNFILTGNTSNGLNASTETESGLLSNNAEETTSLLSVENGECAMDAFGGKDIFGTCDVSNMNDNMFAGCAAETVGSVATAETVGSVAYASAETVGSVASGAEAAGSVACGGGDCGGGGSFSSVC